MTRLKVKPAQVLADVFGEFQGPKNPAEEDLLLACSTSDVPTLNKVIAKETQVNFQCVDILGRTPLQLAIENEDIEVTKLLLPYSDNKNVENCLLFAISLSNENLAMAILRHPRYAEIEAQNKLNPENSFDSLPNNSKFPTPLVLAAEKNVYEVVRHLLVDGKTISVPHYLACSCPLCQTKSQQDHFRFAHERLNAYRGLASESYISLSSQDPILEAFQLRQTLLGLAEREEHFKAEYTDLAKDLSAFSVKLLNKVIGDRELDAVLNKVGGSDEDLYVQLGRLKLAVKLQEKRFVAHPSCQMRLKKLWYKDFEIINRGNFLKRRTIGCVFCISYVFLALAYIVAPTLKILRFMRSPCAKFMSHVLLYVLLLFMLLFSSYNTFPYRLESDITWRSEKTAKYFRFGSDGTSLLIRNVQTGPLHYLIFVWVVGFAWQEVKELHRAGFKEHFSSVLNWFDLTMLGFYFASYIARFYVIGEVMNSAYYFREGYRPYVNTTIYPIKTAIDLLEENNTIAQRHYGWLNPDRYYWHEYDAVIICEGLFAIANVLDFTRFAYVLPAFEALGTLRISFGIMIKDILKFMSLFVLVFLAFVVGLANLYWFYGVTNRQSVELKTHTAPVVEESFGDLLSAFKYCFWSLFGMGEIGATETAKFKEFPFTEYIGGILYGLFMITCVILLLTMLVAMMSLSFSQIRDDADVEWKFSRTQLFFDYMLPGATLPVPLNLIPTPKSAFYAFRFLFRCCQRKNKTCCQRKNKTEDVKAVLQTTTSISAVIMEVNETKANDDVENETATSDPTLNSDTGMPLDNPELFKYKAVISRLVRRFISDTISSQDDDKDDDNLKDDLLRIRREMANALEMRGREIEQCRKDAAEGRKLSRKDSNDCKQAIDKLEMSLTSITTLITQQAAAMSQITQQAAAMSQITQQAAAMSQLTQQVAAMGQTSSTVEETPKPLDDEPDALA